MGRFRPTGYSMTIELRSRGTQAGHPPWLGNLEQMSPEDQNRSFSLRKSAKVIDTVIWDGQ